MSNIVLELEGKTNDLLSVDNSRSMKMTRLVYAADVDPEYEETLDVAITSVDPSRTHKLFNEKFLDKKLKVTIEEIN